ncbi:LCP family protein [Clostridium aestuarii]|uniref:LCP family protein n=1 Tax=Clostridium aestuarii TaxID=338193 RepID=A0ABT4CWJ2_9CLOT|nr:LCP family protein [Clostridium aestuarii]MCY6483377.1 LCP family protein [Clostridium aestuarii]
MLQHNKKLKITIIVIITLIISTISYFIYAFQKNSYISDNSYFINTKDNVETPDEPNIETPNLQEIDGITNILLIGSDARNLDEKSRSDALMILTIDDVHKKLKITSIMRDTYAKIPGYGEQKINHAFVYGGPNLLLKTIENNFNIKLDKYVIINFFGFKDLIDSIDGLELNVKTNEIAEINKYILEVDPKNPHLLKKSGLQHLDGQQVLSYSRIRHVGNGSYERTERQRHVISLIIDKLKDTSIIKYPSVASSLFPCIKTNMTLSELMDYAYTVYKIDNFNLEQLQMPLTELSHGQIYGDKGWVLLIDKKQNSDILNKFIFDDQKYTKSDLSYKSFKRIIAEYLSKLPKPKENENIDKTNNPENNNPTEDNNSNIIDTPKNTNNDSDNKNNDSIDIPENENENNDNDTDTDIPKDENNNTDNPEDSNNTPQDEDNNNIDEPQDINNTDEDTNNTENPENITDTNKTEDNTNEIKDIPNIDQDKVNNTDNSIKENIEARDNIIKNDNTDDTIKDNTDSTSDSYENDSITNN